MSRRALALAAALLALLVATGLWLVVWRPARPAEAREVTAGVLVSGQPRAAEWRPLLARLGVRAVVNLRGARPSERWYADEVAACRELAVAHEDVRVKLDDWPPQHEVRRYVAFLESGGRPLLLHCKDGVDRSGWGAAVALALAGAPLEDALAQLSPLAGHVCDRSSCPLHRFFALYERHLEESGTPHGAAAFRAWAMERYAPPPYDAAIDVLTTPLPRWAQAGEPIALSVRVTNRSGVTWEMRAGPERGIRLGARAIGPFATPPPDPIAIFRTPNGPALDLARAGLENATVPPGGVRELELRFAAPTEPGAYVIAVDMVDEHVHWFSDLGGPGVLLPLEVTPAR